MEKILMFIIIASIITKIITSIRDYLSNIKAKNKILTKQEEYERFMEMPGNYDDDEEDIKAHKVWRDKVYK